MLRQRFVVVSGIVADDIIDSMEEENEPADKA